MESVSFPKNAGLFQEILQKVIQGRKEKNGKENEQEAALKESGASGVSSKIEGSLGSLQKSILDAALNRFAQVKDELLKEIEKLFSSHAEGANGASSSLEQMKLSYSETTFSAMSAQGESGSLSIASARTRSVNLSLSATLRDRNGSLSKIQLDFTLQESFISTLRSSRSALDSKGTAPSEKLKLLDPLVIDYLGNGTELKDKTFKFDLDSDGKPDQISMLKRGSGFLALDKNGDGKINNGSELFGTKSGDGFADLARYDSNGDHKIDKNDPIFSKLRIWTPDENGNGRLMGLGEAGIGTIYLNAKRNEQILRGSSGNILGIKRKSAGFERLNGTKGELHHIDLAKLGANRQKQDSALKNHNLSTYTNSTPSDIFSEQSAPQSHKNETLSSAFNEMWLNLERVLTNRAENSANLLDEAFFKRQLRAIKEELFNHDVIASARRLLR
ncbi:MAG: hypothetical protein ACTTH5_03995 [Wolinella sp.]